MLLNGFRNAKFLTIESPSCLRNNLVDINIKLPSVLIEQKLCKIHPCVVPRRHFCLESVHRTPSGLRLRVAAGACSTGLV